jgi:autotransporter passenger strand-loop-strand repeat protein
MPIVSSGATISDVDVASGQTLEVQSGGAVSGVAVQNGGVLLLDAGAYVLDIDVSSGGFLSIGTLDSTSWDPQALGLVIEAGGSATMDPGALAYEVTVASGAVLDAARLIGPVLDEGLLSGGSAYQTLEVESGGVDIATFFSSGIIDAGGTFEGTVFGSADVYGVQSGVNQGTENLHSGATAVGVTNSGQIIVNSGAAFDGGANAGELDLYGVQSGGANYGSETLYSGASAVGVTNYEQITASSGALVSGVHVLSGGRISLLDAFISQTNTVVYSGGLIDTWLSVASGQTSAVSALYPGGQRNWWKVIFPLQNDGASVQSGAGFYIDGILVSSGGVLSGPGSATGDITVLGQAINFVLQAQPGQNAGQNTLEVGSGGYVADVTLMSNTDLVVDSGAQAQGVTLFTNASAVISAGGLTFGLTEAKADYSDSFSDVDDWGVESQGIIFAFQTVESGGSTVGDQISGGRETVSSGGEANGATVDGSGGVLDLEAGAYGSADTILSGGVITVQTGAMTTALMVSSGGLAWVGPDSNVSGAVFSSGATLDIIIGVVAGQSFSFPMPVAGRPTLSGALLQSGAFLNILDTQVASGGLLDADGLPSWIHVSSGGVVIGEIQNPAGATISEGGRAISATVISGAQLTLSGGVGSADTVLGSASATLLSGASAFDLTVSSGGYVFLDDSASLTNATFSSGATLEADLVASSGLTAFPSSAPDGSIIVRGATLKSGAILHLDSAIVLAGGVLDVTGLAVPIVVSSGGEVTGDVETLSSQINTGTASITLNSGAEVSALTLSSGAFLSAWYGVSYDGLVIGSGASAYLGFGQAATDVIVSSGGYLLATLSVGSGQSGGQQSDGAFTLGGVTLESGAIFPAGAREDVIDVLSGGALDASGLSGFMISLQGGQLIGQIQNVDVEDQDGLVDGAIVGSGGQLTFYLSGVGTSITVLSGGLLSDFWDGTISGLTVSSGGYADFDRNAVLEDVTIFSGGLVSGDLVVDSGQSAGLAPDGSITLDGVTLKSGAVMSGVYVAQNGGILDASGLNSAFISAISGGEVTGEVSDIEADISETGVALDATIADRGVLQLFEGATGSSVNVLSGGVVRLLSGAVISGLTVSSGGIAVLQDGATLTDSVIMSGAVLEADLVVSAETFSVAADATGAYNGATLQSRAILTFDSIQVQTGGVLDATGLTTGDPSVQGGGELTGEITVTSAKISGSGLALSATVASQGILDLGWYASGSALIVQNAGVLQVEGGATVSGVLIDSGGFASIGGHAAELAVLSGGMIEIDFGNIDLEGAASIESGGILGLSANLTSGEVVDLGPQAQPLTFSGVALASGAVITPQGLSVGSGAVLDAFGSQLLPLSGRDDTGIDGGGLLIVEAGAVVQDMSVGGNGSARFDLLQVYSGQSVSVTLGLNYGDRQISGVYMYGGSFLQVDVFDVSSAGSLTLQSGAAAGTVESGGVMILSSGATGSGLTISSGGTLVEASCTVSGGQSVVDGTISADAVFDGVTFLSGAILEIGQAIVLSGGLLQLSSGAVLSALNLSSGGEIAGAGVLDLGAEGRVVAGELSGPSVSGPLELSSGATAFDLAILSGGTLTLDSGSTASGLSIFAGGVETVGSASSTDVTVSSGGVLALGSGGVISGLRVLAGGTVSGIAFYGPALIDERAISAAHTAAGILSGVELAGALEILSGGQASNVEVTSGSELQIDSGASAASISVDSGGSALVESGALTSVDQGYFSVLTVNSGGSVTLAQVVIASGETVSVQLGILSAFGTESLPNGVVINLGGFLRVDDFEILSGGQLSIQSGVVAGVVSSGGSISLGSGATADGLVVSSGASVTLVPTVSSGQTLVLGPSLSAVTSTVNEDGLTLLSGATVSVQSAVVLSGGVLSLGSGGQIQGLTVSSGGEAIGAGTIGGPATYRSSTLIFGLIEGLTIASQAYVEAGGVADDVVVSGYRQDAFLWIEPGASATGTILQSAGALFVSGGGVESGAVIGSGANESLFGGSATGDTILSGGSLGLGSGADVGFSGNWAVSDLTVGAGATIDLYDYASATVTVHSSADHVASSGQVVSSAAMVATIGLAGDVSDLDFTTAGDGYGGTDIFVTAEDFSHLTGTVTSTVDGGETDDLSYDLSGALLADERVTLSGGQTVTQYLTASGTQYAASILQDLGWGETTLQDFDGSWTQKDATITFDEGSGGSLVETFDGEWNRLGAAFTQIQGGDTIVQTFGGAWNQLSASITANDAADGVTITQTFDSAWSQTSAVRVADLGGGVVQTQYFDAHWNQTSATRVTSNSDGSVETQDFNANWVQTGATIVSHPNVSTTITQYFDSAWNQLSADIVTVSGDVTTDRTFDARWNPTGGTVTTAIDATTDLVQTYDAAWDRLANGDHLIVSAQPGPQVFVSDSGVPATYVFHPGDINGDAFSGFVTAAANPAAHDVLEFVGYGAGAALTQIDASHWRITAPGQATEVFTLAAALNPAAGDVVFT